MKRLNLLLTLTGFLLFTSCSGDEFKLESDNPRIQGTWKWDLTYYEISGETKEPPYVIYHTLYSNNTGYTYSGPLSGDVGEVAEIEWAFINNKFRYRYLGPAEEKHGNGIRGFEVREFEDDGFWTTEGDHYCKVTGKIPDYETLMKEQYGEGNSENDDEKGENSSGEVPDIWLENYTCHSTQLQLVFRFESDDKITSAEVNYGTKSSNLSKTKKATIVGSLIKTNISGLKNGETYYVRAKAKNKNGQGVSKTIKIIYQWKD